MDTPVQRLREINSKVKRPSSKKEKERNNVEAREQQQHITNALTTLRDKYDKLYQTSTKQGAAGFRTVTRCRAMMLSSNFCL